MGRSKAQKDRQLALAGLLTIAAGLEFIIAVFIAQANYPGYSITENTLSDLGATCHNATSFTPNSCLVYQPASTIFNTALLAMGLLIMTSAILSYRRAKSKVFSTPLLLLGIGALIAGIFTEQNRIVHSLGALVQFTAGIATVLTSRRVQLETHRYFRSLSALVGPVSLAALIIFLATPFNSGGLTERVVVYPIILWTIDLGALFYRTARS